LSITNCWNLREIKKFALYGKHPKLSEISFFGNSLSEVPKAFSSHAYPIDYEMEKNQTTDQIDIFPALKELDLSLNFIEKIEGHDFSVLKHLEVLNLRHNLIKTLPISSIGFSKNLHATIHNLFLGSNKLTATGPDLFQNFKNLTILDLSGNIGQVPTTEVQNCECPEDFEITKNVNGEVDDNSRREELCLGRDLNKMRGCYLTRE